MTRPMMNPKLRMTLALAGGTALLGTGIGAATLANAEPATPPPAPTSTASNAAGEHDKKSGDHDGPDASDDDSALAKALADKLGVDQAKVARALEAADDSHDKSDDKQESDDSDDDDNADDNGKSGHDDGGPKPSEAERRTALAAALAKDLGVDQAKVSQALTEIAGARQDASTAELGARLDRAVSDGTLTRAEADAVLKAAKAGVISGGGDHHR